MTIATSDPYADTARDYVEKGWVAPLPLPAGQKGEPPSGFTGWRASRWVTCADVDGFIERSRGTGANIGNRAPRGVVGIDYDAYRDPVKIRPGHGYADRVASWGELPPTWASTSRDDGSMIKWYRVPEDSALPGDAGDDVETIHADYRYAVAPPSRHPDGPTYRWLTPTGEVTTDIPHVDELPDLPEAWREGLSGLARTRVTGDEVARFLRELCDGDYDDDTQTVLDEFNNRLNGAVEWGRFADCQNTQNAMLRMTMDLAIAGACGAPGVPAALAAAEDIFVTYRISRGDSPRDAEGSWMRALGGAVGYVRDNGIVPLEPFEVPADITSPSIWDERPILRHLHDFARGRRVAPLAVLGVALARIVSATPSNIVLPPTIGGDGTLNLFVAFVGASGQGKGSAEAAATDAIDLSALADRISGEPIRTVNVGSGEGFVHQYVVRKQGELVRLRDSVLFSIPEVDTLSALGARQGATLMPALRSAWSGEQLGFSYADPTKALDVPARSYRCSLMLGVQPTKAGPLLEDAEGGTPQRFLWVPVTDPEMPRERPTPPEPIVWERSFPTVPRYEMAVCQEATDSIDEAHWQRSRGEGDPLDGHRLYTRLKVAAALALLDRRLDVTSDDWRLSGRILAQSDETRAGVQRALRERSTEANIGRAKAEAARAVVLADEVDAQAVQRASRAVKTALGKTPKEWMSRKDLRGSISGRRKPYLDDALAALTAAGDIEVETVTGTSEAGSRYRLRA